MDRSLAQANILNALSSTGESGQYTFETIVGVLQRKAQDPSNVTVMRDKDGKVVQDPVNIYSSLLRQLNNAAPTVKKLFVSSIIKHKHDFVIVGDNTGANAARIPMANHYVNNWVDNATWLTENVRKQDVLDAIDKIDWSNLNDYRTVLAIKDVFLKLEMTEVTTSFIFNQINRKNNQFTKEGLTTLVNVLYNSPNNRSVILHGIADKLAIFQGYGDAITVPSVDNSRIFRYTAPTYLSDLFDQLQYDMDYVTQQLNVPFNKHSIFLHAMAAGHPVSIHTLNFFG